jgi:hypothetical protein
MVFACALLLTGACVCSRATAQSPSVLYTWDQSFGEAVGPNVEGWAFGFGGNSVTLDNTTDGTLGITETGATPGLDWAISDSFNRIKESFNPADYGGLDLTGLSSLQLDLGHSDPTNTINGQVFAQVGPGSDFKVLGPISVLPGAPQTYTVPLSGLAANQIDAIRTIGVQIFDHSSQTGNLSWKLNEIRSVGTQLVTRRVADYPVGAQAPAPAAAFEGAIFNFDADNVSGHTAGQQDNSGMSYNGADGALTWTETGSSAGAAVTWGSGNGVGLYPPTEFSARPSDFSNYKFAHIRIAVRSNVAGDDVDVQFYTQGAGFAYHTGGPDQHFTATTTTIGQADYHDLYFPLAGITDLDQTQFHGINLGAHNSTWSVRVDFLEYTSVPEPASMVLLGLGSLGAFGLVWKKR